MNEQATEATETNSAKAPAKPTRSGTSGKRLPDVASLPANAVNREGRRVRKTLR
jgi:hypothetical protein